MTAMTATTEAPPTCPNVGIYDSVPDADYRAWDAAANSDLSMIYEFSPMHMMYRRKNPPEPTPALALGTAVHLAILDPIAFDETYTVAEKCSATVKSTGKPCENDGTVLDCGAWYCGVHGKGKPNQAGGIKTISASDFQTCQNIAQAVRWHDAAGGLLGSEGKNELSAVFHHPDNALRSKLRADMWRPTWETVGDIKTTENASRAEFERSIATYGYHRQAAWYLDGLKALGLPAKHFAFICVEKKAPYGVAVYRLMEDAIEAGREELRKLVRIYANCRASNKWFGYESQFQDISVAPWVFRRLFNQQGE